MLCNLDRLRDLMTRDGIDAVVGTSFSDVLYLSDFDNPLPYETGTGAAAVVPAESGRPSSLILAVPYLAHLVDVPTWMDRVEVFGNIGLEVDEDNLSPVEATVLASLQATADRRRASKAAAIVAALGACGALGGRVAFTDPAVAGLLGEEWTGEVVDGAGLLAETALIKTPEEVSRLRRSAEINERAFDAGTSRLTAGADWRDIHLEWSATWARLGGLPRFWGGGAGGRSSQFYTPEASYAVADGDLVRYEGGGTFRGYWADTGRSLVVGAPDDRALQFAEGLRAGFETVREFIRPGGSPDEACTAVVHAIREAGAPTFPDSNAWGHGIGLSLNEAPRFRPGAPDRLAAGMVICFETPYFELGWGGLQLEDTYLITEDGHELLTHADRGLVSVD